MSFGRSLSSSLGLFGLSLLVACGGASDETDATSSAASVNEAQRPSHGHAKEGWFVAETLGGSTRITAQYNEMSEATAVTQVSPDCWIRRPGKTVRALEGGDLVVARKRPSADWSTALTLHPNAARRYEWSAGSLLWQPEDLIGVMLKGSRQVHDSAVVHLPPSGIVVKEMPEASIAQGAPITVSWESTPTSAEARPFGFVYLELYHGAAEANATGPAQQTEGSSLMPAARSVESETLECAFVPTNATGTIPAAAIAQLADPNGDDLVLTVSSRELRDKAEGDWNMRVEVRSYPATSASQSISIR